MAVISEQETKFTLTGKTRGLDTMDKEVKKVTKSVAGVEKKMAALTKRMQNHTKASISGWQQIAVPILAAVASIQALQAAYNLAIESAKFEQQETAFRKLSASYGTDSNSLIADLKKVSAQTLSTKDVMTSAGKAMLLGIPVEKLSTMMQIARSSSRITGQTVQQAFEDISIGMGRQSKLILDNLGIVFKTNEAYKIYAQRLNKTASQLTDAEKKQAFMNAALKAGENIVNRVGAENLTLAEKQAKAIAALSDLRIEFGKLATTIMSQVLPSLESFTNGLEGISVLIKDMLGDLEKNGDKAHDMGVAYQNARINAEKLGRQIKKLKEEQGFTEKDAQIQVLRQQEMVWLKLQNSLMKDVRKEIQKTKEAEAVRAAQKQAGGGNIISPENLRALEAYKTKTAAVNSKLAASTFARIQKEVLAEAKGLSLKEAAYLAHVKRIKATADGKAADEIAKARQTAAGLLEIARGNTEEAAAIRTGLNARLEQIDLTRRSFIDKNISEIVDAQKSSQDAQVKEYEAYQKQIKKADQNTHVAEFRKNQKAKAAILKKFNAEYKKTVLGSFDYEVSKLLDKYKYLEAAGADKLALEEWYSGEVRKLWDDNAEYFKNLENDKNKKATDSNRFMKDAVRGTTDAIKGLWDSSYRGSGGIKDIFKNAANTFIDNLFRMEVQSKVTSIKIQADMAAMTAGLSIVLGVVGGLVGSLFGGSGERIKSLGERLKEVFDNFIDKFGTTIEDFRWAIMTSSERIAEANRKNQDSQKEIVSSFERLKFLNTLPTIVQSEMARQGRTIQSDISQLDVYDAVTLAMELGIAIPDTLIEKYQDAGRRLDEVLVQERELIASRAMEMRNVINKRYKEEEGLINEIAKNINNLQSRQKDWGKSLDTNITKLQRDGMTASQLFNAARGDVDTIKKRLRSLSTDDHEARLAAFKELKTAYNALYTAGKNALVDGKGASTPEFEILKAEVVGGLQELKKDGISEFDAMIEVQRNNLYVNTGTRDATRALFLLQSHQTQALQNLLALGTGDTTSVSPYLLQSFPGYASFAGATKLASGLDYVPYDNFPAILHQGEKVVPAEENTDKGNGDTVEISLNFDSENFARIIIPQFKEKARIGELTFDIGAVVDRNFI